MPRSVWVPLTFIFVSLLALVLVPVYHGRQISSIEGELTGVLEPARELSTRLSLEQSEQMAALQGFLLSGDTRYRQRYRAAQARESAVYDSLNALSGELDLAIRERMAALWSESTRWRLDHVAVISGDVDPEEYGAFLSGGQQMYERVVRATQDLRDAIGRRAEEARRRMDEAREQQIWITAGLAGLGFASTAAICFVGWKMLGLVRFAQHRREEAVGARREIDAILAATGDGVLGIDMDGRCTFLNEAGSELLGIPSQRLLGRKVHERIHHSRPDGSPYPAGACPILRGLREGQTMDRGQEILWRVDGSTFPAQVSVRPMVDGLEVVGAVLTFTDLTEIRRTEKALRQAVRARDEVVAVVSHDLRNPLATVSSASELLLEVDLPEERRQDHLQAISRSAERMLRLIEDLLDVANIEAGALAVDERPVPVAELLDDAMEMSEPLSREGGIELERRVEEGLDEVSADPDRILQVFSNLVGNAVRFTPEGGRIVLSAGRGKAADVVFGVDDSGPGISEEDQEHLFDRFWKVDRLDRKGSGLGLAIVKGIVEAHGGRVWVESERGRGARFRFTLPAPATRSSAAIPAARSRRPW